LLHYNQAFYSGIELSSSGWYKLILLGQIQEILADGKDVSRFFILPLAD